MNRHTQLMNWLHSWSGLLFGWLLFAIFLTGSLTVFDTEITSWMQPELHEITSNMGQISLQVCEDLDVSVGSPFLHMIKFQEKRTFSGQTVDPVTGRMVTFRDTQGGDFFYHFHSGLLLGLPGAWIVGIAGTTMFVALSTGLVIHRRIVKDVFRLQPQPVPQRAWVDVHNVTGLLVFPFSLVITLTGLTLFWSISMPVGFQFLTGGDRTLSVLSDLHFAQFGSTLLRWLYFVMGLAASAMIATGLVLWTNKRRKFLAEHSCATRVRLAENFNVAIVAGLLVAIAAFFWANRLLPMALPARALWEVRCLFIVWFLCLMHSLLRGRSSLAWKEQLYLAAFLLTSLPLLNGLTTQSHLLVTVPNGQWAVAGVDLTAEAVGILLGWMARRLCRAGLDSPNSQAAPMVRSDAESEQADQSSHSSTPLKMHGRPHVAAQETHCNNSNPSTGSEPRPFSKNPE